MRNLPDSIVFDTGPIRHFCMQGWLGILKFLAGDRPVIIPESVEFELKNQAHELPALNQVFGVDWITVDRSGDLNFLMAFAGYEKRLVENRQNRGECGVLALGRTRGFEMVLDDSVPRTIAEEEGLRVTATLPLLCNAIRDGLLTVPMVEALADDLIASTYYLPFGSGGFRRWAHESGIIEYRKGSDT